MSVDVGEAPPDAAVDMAVDMAPMPDMALTVDAAPVDAAPDGGPGPCTPALELSPAEMTTSAFDLAIFEASGGTGAYHYTLVENRSGGTINAITGVYLAGGLEGVADRVQLTDDGCIGEATATVYVADALLISPARVEVARGQTVVFTTSGGSGEVQFDLFRDRTGAALTPDGRYTAGEMLGQDVVRIVDPVTRLEAEAIVDVVDAPSLVADPGALYLPLGSWLPLTVTGGSNVFVVETRGTSASYDAETGMVTAHEPGLTTLVFDDVYTPLSIEVPVEVSTPLDAPLRRAGRGRLQASVIGPGDLDGDGYPDLIVAHSEQSIDHFDSGAVYVHRGGPEGIEPDPSLVLSGERREARFGIAATVADLDGDGQLDLLVGATGRGTSNQGGVYVFAGIAGGTFDPTPQVLAVGRIVNEFFGDNLAVCDFDGDGFVDVAVGAHLSERRDVDPAPSNQGAVYLFLGGPDGLSAEADQVLYGGELDAEGAWVDAADLQLPSAMAAGDVDGDGRCDLVAGATRAGGDSGAIFVYRGRGAGEGEPVPEGDAGMPAPDRGGLEAVPARIYHGLGGSRLGRRMAVADLNGDGMADIIAGQHQFDFEDSRDVGAVRVFAGGPLDGGPVVLDETAADASYIGADRNENLGVAVATGDWDGDGQLDLLLGAWHDVAAVEEPIPDPGGIRVLRGRAGGWPDAAPIFTAFGSETGALFGEALATLGDLDGDGLSELAVTDGRSRGLGPRVGRAYVQSSGGDAATPLDMPAVPAGGWNGWAVATVGDVDGDGLSDLLVGAPELPYGETSTRAGAAWLYPGVDGGYAAAPSVVFDGHYRHGDGDRHGYAVAGGDFDGDGRADVAVGALGEEAPNSYDEALYALEGECTSARDQGFVQLYLGDGLDPQRPDVIYMGPHQGAGMAGIVLTDLDGDGRDDLIVSGNGWDEPFGTGNNVGGIDVLFGRPRRADGRIEIRCQIDYRWRATTVNANAGHALAAAGDLNGDGCQDLLIGAYNEAVALAPDAEPTTQAGAARVLYGWGGAGCPAQPRMTTLFGGGARLRAGFSVAAGQLVGGPEPDLAVGVTRLADPDGDATGGAIVVDGARLAALGTHDPTDAQPPVHVMGLAVGDVEVYGGVNNEQAGRAVAVADGRLVVSRFSGRVGDRERVGGAEVWAFAPDGTARRAGSVSGETWREDGRLGEELAYDAARGLLLLGGLFSSGLVPEGGAVYPFHLSPGR